MITMIEIRSQLDCAEVRDLVNQLEYPVEMRKRMTEQILTEYRENPSQPILGADVNGELVGFIGFRPVPPDRAVIRHIAVRRDRRRQGIGKQMVLHVCNVYSLQEITAETDRDAIAFYRRVGFRVESFGEKYPGTVRFLCRLARTVQQSTRGDAEDRAP